MVILIRCNDIVSDSRAKKYVQYYTDNGIEYHIIAWDRTCMGDKQPNTIYYPKRSFYNQGGFKAVIDRIGWMWFVFKTLLSFKQDLIVHACDIDAAFPAIVYKRLSRKKNFIIFDVFDWFSDTLYNQGKVVLYAFSFMEKKSVEYSDHIIICEEERINQIPYDISTKYSVLQNIPSFSECSFLYEDKHLKFNNEKITLSYVGTFCENRCLDELLEGAEHGLYNLLLAGYGSSSIEERAIKAEKIADNVKYFGKVNYEEGLRLTYNSDIVYACYAKANPNHFYAAPNKFYEAMFTGKPIITTCGIIVEDKVKKLGFGYAFDESYEKLEELIKCITKDDIKTKSEKSSSLWNEYKNRTVEYLNNVYSKLITKTIDE